MMTVKQSWTRGVLALACAGGLGLVLGEEPVAVRQAVSREGDPALAQDGADDAEPWLGVYLSKSAPAVHAQLHEVPEGVGFTVDGVVEGGPAAEAGLRVYDFVWKMDDQLLVNIGQFLTLLNLREEGEEVTLTVQRGGENQEITMKVGTRPESEKGREMADLAVLAPPLPGFPSQFVNVLQKVAELRDDGGTVRIWRNGEGFGWAEYDAFDLELRAGTLSGSGEDGLPEGMDTRLKGKLQALVRAYEQAERNHENGNRPRVRRLPDTPPPPSEPVPGRK